jgi:glycosyltransferase involved in cell wall biosynthesis
MNIIIDVTRVVRRKAKKETLTGIDRVTMAYVEHYKDRAYALLRCCGYNGLLSLKQSRNLFYWLTKEKSIWVLFWIFIKGILQNKNLNPANSFLLNTGHISLKHSDYERLIKQTGIKPIFFVHDLIPINYPEYCSPNEDKKHQEKINYILKLGYGIIANSQSTLIDLQEYTQKKQQQLPPSISVLLGSIFSNSSPEKRPINKQYFVILSTIEPRKNHLLLLNIWKKLFKELGANAPHLFVIGRRGWECENVIDLLDRSKDLMEVITEIPSCSDSDLLTYLSHSQALLFPSFVEGYGLPLIEALSLGVPVIASNLAVFREIANDVPEYIDPLDGKKWEQMIREYSQNDNIHRKNQIERITNLTLPTWENHFNYVDSFLFQLNAPK